MKQETGQYVDSGAGALKGRGSAGLGVITERKPDIAFGRRTHLRGLDIKRCTHKHISHTKAKM